MAEGNGQHSESPIERLERTMNFIIDEHERFRQEQQILLRAQVVFQDDLKTLTSRVDRLAIRVDEIGGKLDVLIDVVERDHRDFNERLKRLNG